MSAVDIGMFMHITWSSAWVSPLNVLQEICLTGEGGILHNKEKYDKEYQAAESEWTDQVKQPLLDGVVVV